MMMMVMMTKIQKTCILSIYHTLQLHIFIYTIQYNTVENLHSKTDKQTVSLI